MLHCNTMKLKRQHRDTLVSLAMYLFIFVLIPLYFYFNYFQYYVHGYASENNLYTRAAQTSNPKICQKVTGFGLFSMPDESLRESCYSVYFSAHPDKNICPVNERA